MTINGPEGLYIPDQRQADAEMRARIEADYWQSMAMNQKPLEVIKEVNQLSPNTFNGMTEAHDRLWEQLKEIGRRDKKLRDVVLSQEDYLSTLAESLTGYDAINNALLAAVSGEKERMDRACQTLGVEIRKARSEREKKLLEIINTEWLFDPVEKLPMLTKDIQINAFAALKARLDVWKSTVDDVFPNHDKVVNKNTKFSGFLKPENKDWLKFAEEICEREALFKVDSKSVVNNIINVERGHAVINKARVVGSGSFRLADQKNWTLDAIALMAYNTVAQHILKMQEKQESDKSTTITMA